MKDYFNKLNKKQANLAMLILASQGISADHIKNEDSFDIIIKNEDEKVAAQTLEKYFLENKNRQDKNTLSGPPLSWQSPATFTILIMLCMIHLLSWHKGIHGQLIREYGSSALYIFQGEYFRAITALMLHADIVHLTGNLLGLFVFATGVFSLTGYGRGGLMILLSGFFGNITNAYFKKGVILSIGASTSVLGAAGILTAIQIRKKRETSISNIETFAPFAAGMALLAFLSGGENTDISAHLFGFFWGLIIGIIYTEIVMKDVAIKSDNPDIDNLSDDITYTFVSIIIIIAAWMKYF